MTNTKHCPQCGTEQTVSEPYAFGGMDKLRMTLSCGHIIPRAGFSASASWMNGYYR